MSGEDREREREREAGVALNTTLKRSSEEYCVATKMSNALAQEKSINRSAFGRGNEIKNTFAYCESRSAGKLCSGSSFEEARFKTARKEKGR